MPQLEASNLLIWGGAIALIGGFALLVMLWAYVGSGSRNVRFPQPLRLPTEIFPSDMPLAKTFEAGCTAFSNQDFEEAIAHFTNTLKSTPNLALAHHNLGRLQANRQQDREALPHFMRAADLYLDAKDMAGYDQVMADLETMRQNIASA